MNASSDSPAPPRNPPQPALLPRTPEDWVGVARVLSVWRATMAAEVALYGHVTRQTAEGALRAVAAAEAAVITAAATAASRSGAA